MTVFLLKIIAMVTMLVDHVTYCFIPRDTFWYLLGRGIGRLAFPIFCFLLVEGFYYTRSLFKYCLRLLIAAVLSEVPFDMFSNKAFFYWNYQNVLWTLLLGLLTIAIIDALKKKFYPFKNLAYNIYSSIAIFVAAVIAMTIGSDYGAFGVVLIVALYYCRGHNRIWAALAFLVICLAFYGFSANIEFLGVLAFLPLCFYKGEKGRNDHHLFYAFYPAHMLVLGILVMFVFV